MTLLQVEDICKSFGGLLALDRIKFAVNEGEILGLMGANGAGKTTLFSIIAGHTKSDSGAVYFKTQRINNLRPDQICKLGVSRTFQIVRPFAGMSAKENVETAILFGAAEPGKVTNIASSALRILEEVGLASVANQSAGSLTLSARKRLEVARALGTQPRLLLLDEVMAGLTPTEVEQMIETVIRIKQQYDLTIVIVEHVVKALTALSERLIVLHHGKLIAEGSPGEVAAHPDVRHAYFGDKES